MSTDEAVQMLGMGLHAGQGDELRKLTRRLGEWPVLLKLVNGVLRSRVNDDSQRIEDALTYVNEDLNENGLTTFDALNSGQRDAAVAATLEVSLSRISDVQRRYEELAVFREDTDIPLSTLEAFWRQTGGLSKLSVEKLCDRLSRLSLRSRFDLNARTIRLHDVIRAYLARRLPDLAGLHATLVEAWGDKHHLPDGYAWRWYAYHVKEGNGEDKLTNLLVDFDWLQAKLDATDITALIIDYDEAKTVESQNFGEGMPGRS